MAYQTVPADSDRAATRSTTRGFVKPTTAQERHERAIAERCRFLLTLTCREVAGGEHDRGELACWGCLNHRYYLPCAQQNFTSEELKGLLVGHATSRGYSKEKVLKFMVDKAGTRYTSCNRLEQSRKQFAILESIRQRIEKVEWAKIQRGEGN